MEKAPVDIDASNVAKDDITHKPNQQDDDLKPDYSSKATTKTKFSDYLRIFTYSTLVDKIFLVGKFYIEESPEPSLFRVSSALGPSL
jgi:ATP-binding cassette, subfamily B (MDR/TAP), member 1